MVAGRDQYSLRSPRMRKRQHHDRGAAGGPCALQAPGRSDPPSAIRALTSTYMRLGGSPHARRCAPRSGPWPPVRSTNAIRNGRGPSPISRHRAVERQRHKTLSMGGIAFYFRRKVRRMRADEVNVGETYDLPWRNCTVSLKPARSASCTAPNILCRFASAQKSPTNTGLRASTPIRTRNPFSPAVFSKPLDFADLVRIS